METSADSSPSQDDFFWGVSNSAYQHEGGINTSDGPWNSWRDWEERGRIETTGRAVDFWNRYPEDFQLAADLGCNAFRLSLSWARLQPSREVHPHTPPPMDQEALNHYITILVEARRKGLEPLLTLFHFAHPYWMGTDPWLDRQTPRLFADFAEQAMMAINEGMEKQGVEPVRWLVTINEPNMLSANTYNSPFFPAGPKRGVKNGLVAVLKMLEAHVLAYRRLHALYDCRTDWGRPMISFNTYASDLYWNDKFLIDLVSLSGRGVHRSEAIRWLHGQAEDFDKHFKEAHLKIKRSPSYWLGVLIKWLHDKLGRRYITSARLDEFLDLLYAERDEVPMDYIGFDYYEPFVFNTFRFPRWRELTWPRTNLRQWCMESLTARWWEWKAPPEGLRLFVDIYCDDFPDRPIIIAENGMAEQAEPKRAAGRLLQKFRRDKLKRPDYIRGMLREVIAMRREGKNLGGYFHWSLTDNYEWGSYQPRFGLYSIDFDSEDLKRHEEVDENGVSAARAYREMIQASDLVRSDAVISGDAGHPWGAAKPRESDSDK